MYTKIKQYLFDLMISRKLTNELLIKREDVLRVQSKFDTYRGCLKGKKVVIVATGPSLNKYVPMSDAVHIGINKAFLRDDIKFDYYFVQDYAATKDYVLGLKDVDCTKFVGIYILDRYIGAQVPRRIMEQISAIPYYLTYPVMTFAADLSTAPLTGASTTVITAMQFAVYAGAKEIYLVGCDTSTSGYFDNSKNRYLNPKVLIKDYIAFRDFVDKNCIDTKVISINPVGLKGIFADKYI